jgi:hypothetical protein
VFAQLEGVFVDDIFWATVSLAVLAFLICLLIVMVVDDVQRGPGRERL